MARWLLALGAALLSAACDVEGVVPEVELCPPEDPRCGGSCGLPITVPDGADQALIFGLRGRLPSTVLSCGAMVATPDVAFRWRATLTETVTFEIRGGTLTTDLVLEVWDTPICAGVSLGCGDQRSSEDLRPWLQVPVTAGLDYWIVVATRTPEEPVPLGDLILQIRR